MKQGSLPSIPEGGVKQYGMPDNNYQSELENFVKNHFESEEKIQAFFEYIIQCMLKDRGNDHLVNIFCDSFIHLRKNQNNISGQYMSYVYQQCKYLYAMRRILINQEFFDQVMRLGAYQYMDRETQMSFLAFIHFCILRASVLAKSDQMKNQTHMAYIRPFFNQYINKYGHDPLMSTPFGERDQVVKKSKGNHGLNKVKEAVFDTDIENFELPGDALGCLNASFFTAISLLAISFFKFDFDSWQTFIEADDEPGFFCIPSM